MSYFSLSVSECSLFKTILLIFSGYLIGYLVHQKKNVAPSCAASSQPTEDAVAHETGAAPLMDWDDVSKLLAGKLSTDKFDSVFR